MIPYIIPIIDVPHVPYVIVDAPEHAGSLISAAVLERRNRSAPLRTQQILGRDIQNAARRIVAIRHVVKPVCLQIIDVGIQHVVLRVGPVEHLERSDAREIFIGFGNIKVVAIAVVRIPHGVINIRITVDEDNLRRPDAAHLVGGEQLRAGVVVNVRHRMLTQVLFHVATGVSPVNQVITAEHADGIILQHAGATVARPVKVGRHDIITATLFVLGHERVPTPWQGGADAVNDARPTIQFIEHQPLVFLRAQSIGNDLGNQRAHTRFRHEVRHVAIQVAVSMVVRGNGHRHRCLIHRMRHPLVSNGALQFTRQHGDVRPADYGKHPVCKRDFRVPVHGLSGCKRPFHSPIAAFLGQFQTIVDIFRGLPQIELVAHHLQHSGHVHLHFL